MIPRTRSKLCPVGKMLEQNVKDAGVRSQEMGDKGKFGEFYGSKLEAESLQEKLDKHINSCPMCDK